MDYPDTSKEDQRAAIEHRDVLLDIRAMLSTNSGRKFFKYLFKEFGVGELPVQGLEKDLLLESLGFFRAGQSIFALVSQADHTVAAQLMAENEKEKYETLREISERRS